MSQSAFTKWLMRNGRRLLFGIIVVGLVVSCAIILVFVHYGTLDFDGDDGAKVALEQLSTMYIPSLGIIGAYYWSERQGRKQRHPASADSLWFAIVVTLLSALSPPVVLLAITKTADAVSWIRVSQLFTQTVSASAIAYYFARGQHAEQQGGQGQAPPSQQPPSTQKPPSSGASAP